MPLALIFICVITGCSGSSITPLELSGIKGPATVQEQKSAEYSVDASGDYDLTYLWTFDPPTVGFLKGVTTNKVTLYTYEINKTTKAKLTLVVQTTKLGPVKQSKDIEVVDSNQAPEAMGHSDKTKIANGQYVQFYDDSTDSNGAADISNWEWDFSYDQPLGFKSESTEREPNHQFLNAGIFQIQLRVTDYAGHMDMLDVPLQIEVVQNTAPVITDMHRSRTTCTAGDPDSFTYIQLLYEDMLPDDDIGQYSWQLTDGYIIDEGSWDPAVFEWYPPDYATDASVTIRVTDQYGLYAERTLKLWSTTLPELPHPTAFQIISKPLPSAFGGTIDPGSFRYAYYPDGNVTFVAFWATYASTSVDDMPTLTDIYNTFKDREYVHICINQGETAETVKDFVNTNSLSASHWLLDTDASYFGVMNDWAGDPSSVPVYLLFDRDGRCRWAYAGALTPTIVNSLEQAIEELL